MNDVIFDSTRICPVCGREFYTPDPETWVYKKSRGTKAGFISAVTHAKRHTSKAVN